LIIIYSKIGKREGRIIILLTEGKEVSSYECSLNMKNKIYRIIENGAKNFKFYQNNPLMIPEVCFLLIVFYGEHQTRKKLIIDFRAETSFF
jgi:hypothetical protein